MFHLVSQMVIEEVNVLQTQLEIEKSCRENAEALATKVSIHLLLHLYSAFIHVYHIPHFNVLQSSIHQIIWLLCLGLCNCGFSDRCVIILWQLNCENKKLKYLSLSSRPCLDELLPSISDCISLEEESDPQEHSPDPYTQYQQQVKGKHNKWHFNSRNVRIVSHSEVIYLFHENKRLN